MLLNRLAHLFGLHVSRHRPDRDNLPAFVTPEFIDLYRRWQGFTMTTWTGCYQTWLAARYVIAHRIGGDVVECGVYKGGLSCLMAEMFHDHHSSLSRRFWLYDTFRGMTDPDEVDFDRHYHRSAAEWLGTGDRKIKAVGHRYVVEDAIRRSRVNTDKFVLVEGRVEDTIPDNMPEKISLLRLDTDWYASTRHELEYLFPRLAPGGVLVIDDYGIWDGARKAADEYFARHDICPVAQDTEYGALVVVKPISPASPSR